MSDSLSVIINDDHPLALELSSLRESVSRYQHEAHATSLKLQRHSLEASQALGHARILERENALLKEELVVLRTNPETIPTQSSHQVPELTLALRKLSDKLTAVEDTLLARTKELVDVRSELAAAQHEIEAARAVAAEARAREEESLARERVLERKVQEAQEEQRMADLVVQEYADLVRKLEGRAKAPSTPSSTSSMDLQHSSNGSATTLVNGLSEGKLGLHRLLEEFNGRNERLQADIAQLHSDNGLLYKELEVTRESAEHDRTELANALHALDKYSADDNTAAKMVSRYMKFSQTSTDTLQKAMDALKLRHATTLTSLNAEIAQLQHSLSHEREQSERVRSALDELTEDIAREAYGRRREVAVRLAFLAREENLAESLKRWVLKANESLERSGGSEDGSISLNPMALREAYFKTMADAQTLLDTLNGQPSLDANDASDNSVGSIARLILAQDTVASLTQELQEETIRRLKTERRVAGLETVDHPLERRQKESGILVQPVPHRIAEERHLLDVGVTTSPTNTSSTDPPAVDASPSKSVPVVEVLTVPVIEDAPSMIPTGTSSLPTIPDEISPSIPSAEAVALPNSDPDSSHRDETLDPEGRGEPDQALKLASEVPKDEIPSSAESLATPSPSAADPKPDVQQSSKTATIPFPPHSESPAVVLLQHGPSIPFPERREQSPPASLQDPTRSSKLHVPPPLPLEATNGHSLSSLSPGFGNTNLPTNESKELSLLACLAQVKHRYDDVQRGFRDCHLALKELNKSLAASSSPPMSSPSELSSVLQKAIARLGDYNEDARVELEIRIADEERIISGYEALLSIPGAMSHSGDAEDTDKVDEATTLKEVQAFVDGTDRAVAKATQQFNQKLDDLEHDIASIKRTLHELALSLPEDGLPPTSASSAKAASPSPRWAAWTPSFLSQPRSTSPAPPTFGSVMTSPRLRHSSSFSHPRERAGDESSSAPASSDPLSSLGLRIVVPVRTFTPAYAYAPAAAAALSAGPGGPGRPGASPRQRTTSGMFMLGLGMRSASFGPGGSRQGLSKVPSRSSLASASTGRLASTLSPSASSPQGAVTAEANADVKEGDADSDDVE